MRCVARDQWLRSEYVPVRVATPDVDASRVASASYIPSGCTTLMGGIVYKFWSLSVLALVAACAKGKADGASADTTAATSAPATAPAAAPGAASADTGMTGMHMDADKSAAGTGV